MGTADHEGLEGAGRVLAARHLRSDDEGNAVDERRKDNGVGDGKNRRGVDEHPVVTARLCLTKERAHALRAQQL